MMLTLYKVTLGVPKKYTTIHGQTIYSTLDCQFNKTDELGSKCIIENNIIDHKANLKLIRQNVDYIYKVALRSA